MGRKHTHTVLFMFVAIGGLAWRLMYQVYSIMVSLPDIIPLGNPLEYHEEVVFLAYEINNCIHVVECPCGLVEM